MGLSIRCDATNYDWPIVAELKVHRIITGRLGSDCFRLTLLNTPVFESFISLFEGG